MRFKQQRLFGLVFTVLFMLLGIWPLSEGGSFSLPWLIAAIILMIICLAVPQLLTPFARLWMQFSHLLGWLNTRMLLGLVFFLLITPIGLLARLTGYDPMKLRAAKCRSYWRPNSDGWKPQSFKDQF